jgi:hypothetical protein
MFRRKLLLLSSGSKSKTSRQPERKWVECLLAWLLSPRRWKEHVPPKHRQTIVLHGATSLNILLLRVTDVGTSDLTSEMSLEKCILSNCLKLLLLISCNLSLALYCVCPWCNIICYNCYYHHHHHHHHHYFIVFLFVCLFVCLLFALLY